MCNDFKLKRAPSELLYVGTLENISLCNATVISRVHPGSRRTWSQVRWHNAAKSRPAAGSVCLLSSHPSLGCLAHWAKK